MPEDRPAKPSNSSRVASFPEKKHGAPLHISVIFDCGKGTGSGAKRLLSWNNTTQGNDKVAIFDSMHERKRRSP
jgi:hypothetical protein